MFEETSLRDLDQEQVQDDQGGEHHEEVGGECGEAEVGSIGERGGVRRW